MIIGLLSSNIWTNKFCLLHLNFMCQLTIPTRIMFILDNFTHLHPMPIFGASTVSVSCSQCEVCIKFKFVSLFLFSFFLLFFSKPNYKILNLHFILIVTVSHDGWGSRNAGFGNKNMYREQCREGRTLVLLPPPFFVFPLLFDFSSSNVHSCLNNFGPSKWNDSQSSTN